MSRRITYRTIFLSDVHLGSRGARADALEKFLHHVDCETLYLVGDFIDFWRLKSRAYWPSEHHTVLRRLLKLLSFGTRIVIIPGNHDEALRGYAGLEFGGVSIERTVIHRCADGKRLLVTHGDQFDLVVRHSRTLSMLGSLAYEWLIVINRFYNHFRQWRGKPYWSLSQFIKLKVKSACTFVSRFEEALLKEAREEEVDGVVCGHIHQPELIENDDIAYYNCGDWIESCSAIIEHHNGEMELINYRDVVEDECVEEPRQAAMTESAASREPSCEVDWQRTPVEV